MARYKATIIFDFPDNENRSKLFENIYTIYDRLGINNPIARRVLHYNRLGDIQNDIERRIIEGTDYGIKERTATYEIVSWEQLPKA